jgi:hypothetical protein
MTFIKKIDLDYDFSFSIEKPVPGSLDQKGGRRCNLLLYKRCHPLPPFSV